jgi:hypothetical protein
MTFAIAWECDLIMGSTWWVAQFLAFESSGNFASLNELPFFSWAVIMNA